jgi:tetratricopeptide (TPR) repeat protein
MNGTRPINGFSSGVGRDRSKPARRENSLWMWSPAAAVCVLALTLPWIAGCGGESPDFDQLKQKQANVVAQRDPLSRAFDYLSNLHEFDAARVQPRVLYYLNQWINTQRPDEQWPTGPLYARLPSRISSDFDEDDLSRLEFRASDVDMIRECVWMRDISQSLIRRSREHQNPDTAVGSPWRDEVARDMGERAAQDLQIAIWLFDWTIRHIQLDPMPEAPTQAAGPQPDQASSEEAKEDRIEPLRVVPGGRMTPWETLMLGHGDALERAKVLIGLARQQGIDVVMLHPDEGSAQEGWLAGVFIGDQLFLFDTMLGLPIPGPNGRPVATLAEAMADPTVLRSLDVDRKHVYPLTESDITSMVAYVDAPHEFLSQRMHLLENELAGDRKLVLTAVPNTLSTRLRKCKGVADVRMWLPPYETWRYRVEFSRLMAKLQQARRTGNRQLEARVLAAYDREDVEKLSQEMRIFAGLTPIAQGRLLQFQGEFDRQGRVRGAKAFFMDCRPPEEAFEHMRTDKGVQRELIKMNRLPDVEDEKLMQRAIEKQVTMVRRIKQNASYWLGLIAYEDGQYEAAINFFDQLTLQASPDGPWTNGARYNLARANEVVAQQTGATDKIERAIELYRAGQSPQRHGNLVRAKRLEAELARQSEQ